MCLDLGIKVIHALSPQAKGKIERPYTWIQDHLVRSCIRDNVSRIEDARTILGQEVHAYNYKRIHSTTREIPSRRFDWAIKQKQSLFREFRLQAPFQSAKDIFCIRIQRTTDAYRKISIHNISFKINGASPSKPLLLRIYPLDANLSEIRFWYKDNLYKDNLLDIQKVKNTELNLVHF